MTAYFLFETIKARRQQCDIFKVLKKGEKSKFRISNSEKISFRNQGEMRIFSDMQKLR